MSLRMGRIMMLGIVVLWVHGTASAQLPLFRKNVVRDDTAVSAAVFDESAEYLVTAIRTNAVVDQPRAVARLWNLREGRQTAVFIDTTPIEVESVAISTAKQLVAVSGLKVVSRTHFEFFADADRTSPQFRCVTLWSYDTVARAAETSGADKSTTERLEIWDQRGGDVAFSPDGETLVMASSDGLWTTATGGTLKLRMLANVRCYPTVRPVFSSDGHEVYVTHRLENGRNCVAAIDVETGKIQRTYSTTDMDDDPDNLITSVAISPDGRYLAGARSSYDGRDGQRSAVVVWDRLSGGELRRFACEPFCAAFSRDSRSVLAISSSGQIRQWRIEDGTTAPTVNTGYALTTEYERDFEMMETGFAELSPGGAVGVLAISDSTHSVDAHLVALPGGESLATVRHDREPRRWSVSIGSETILPDTSRHESSRAAQGMAARLDSAPRVVEPAAATGPRLYYLGVGLTDYQRPEYQLRFAVRDVEATSKLFRDQKSISQYADVLVKELCDADATAAKIRSELEWLGRACTPQDIAIVHLAGHGVSGRRGLYFMPHEGDAESIGTTCLNWTEIAQLLANIKARHVLVLLDCCHAADFQPKLANQVAIAETLLQNTAVMVICAAGPQQSALEMTRLQHGLFTATLLDALSGQADADVSGAVTVAEMFAYLRREVAAQSSQQQEPVLLPADAPGDMVIARVPSADSGRPPARRVPALGPAQRRGPDGEPVEGRGDQSLLDRGLQSGQIGSPLARELRQLRP